MIRSLGQALARRDWRDALIATYAFRSVAALLLMLPFVSAVQASGVTQFPGGDHLLFEPGGALLLEVLVSQRAELAAAITPALVLSAVVAVLALGPEFLMLRAAARSQRRELPLASEAGLEPARPLLRRLLLLGAAVLILRALLAGLFLALAFSARSWFASARDPRIPDLVFVSVLALGGLAQLALSTLRDLTAGAIVARGLALPDAVATGLPRLRPEAFGLYTASLMAAVLLVLLGARMVGSIDVSQTQSWRTALAFVIHQAVVLGSIGVRAGWLANAVGRVRE